MGDLDGAIDLTRTMLDNEFHSGEMVYRASGTAVLVDALLRRGTDGDVQEAQAAIDRLASVSTDPGFVLNDLPLLRMRALLARVQGDEAGYHDFADRYRAKATSLGFQGHMATAEAMA